MFKKIKSSPYFKWGLRAFLGLLFIGSLFFISIYVGLWGKIPTKAELTDIKQSQATEIYASGGELMGKYYIFDRQTIPFDQLPKHLIEALIATEDARFYEHSGIDKKSLLRVFVKTILLQDESSGGGSTITLQLAKNLFGRKDYGFLSIVVNKVKEAITARRLEDIYSKDEILALYFNTVPFSDNTYGIESAARKFFGTPASGLSLTQSAILVGSLKANHYYNPRLFPKRAEQRRNTVLHQMEKYGYLSEEKLQEAVKKPLKLDYQYFNHNEGVATYFRSHLRKEVKSILDTLENEKGETYNIFRDGLRIYTTIDYKMQVLAQEAVKEHMSKLQKQFEKVYGNNPPWTNEAILKDAIKNTHQYESLQAAGWSEAEIMDSLQRKSEMELFTWGKNKIEKASVMDSLSHYLKFLNVGMVNIDPSTGAVKSWIGGINHEFFKYDHVSQSMRQVGSTFKPIVYTAALEAGIEPCTYYPVREVTYAGGWTPSNATREEQDPFMNYSMETALSNSINTIAVKVLFDVGLEKVIAQARKMGISSPLPKVPSLALGTAALKVKELAGAYASYVNQGIPVKTFSIKRIENKFGATIFNPEPKTAKEPAFSDTTRQLMVEMMQTTVDSGTAVRLRYKYHLPNDIAGKTGTTQDNKDGWFVAITPNLVSVTWVGTDNHRIGFPNTAIGQGANSALPIFAELMQKMNSDPYFNEITQANFPEPSQKVQRMLDCPPSERDNFFERLFGNSDGPKKYEGGENDENEKKDGFFSRILGIFGKKED
ncbi:MAG TPA: transglycosylase domain-containing protein [Salinimicrobium sp.]|nr:transglycosylase domain-containing protein [Salinimicrobium sp.]